MKVFLETLGCKLNQAESESLAWDLTVAGFEIVSGATNADIYILNTCTVTSTADTKSRQRIRHIHKTNPNAFIVATGCLAERDDASLETIPGTGMVVSNKDKVNIPILLGQRFTASPGNSPLRTDSLDSLRTRAFIKVQEGCNARCAYCIVPDVRGDERSVPKEQVIGQILQREKAGFKEIVITGTNVGRYWDNGGIFADLLGTILDKTSMPRIRISSLQPPEISPGLLSLWQNPRLLPHFHMSLQSGCNETLHRMKRRYSVQQYRTSLEQIRNLIPDAAITTDIIIAFPGETDADFTQSYQFCSEMEFTRIHVFPYSPRPGTEATVMQGRVSEQTRHARLHKMLTLAEESAEKFRHRFSGQERPVLWESQEDRGYWTGWTDNYIQVKKRGEKLGGCIQSVRID